MNLSCSQIMRFHIGPVHCVSYDIEGEYVLSGGQDKIVYLSKPELNGKLIERFDGHSSDILDIKCTNDHTKFISAGLDKRLFVWDIANCIVIRKYQGHTQRIHSVDINDEGTVAITGSFDSSARLWDLRSAGRYPIQILHESKDSISKVSMNSTTYEIISGSMDGSLRLYDFRKGLLTTMQATHPITYYTMTSNGALVFISSLNQPIKLYDIKEGLLLNEYKGHKNISLRCMTALSFDEKFLLSGSEDGDVYTWDFMSSAIQTTLKGHTHPACSIAAHPKQMQVISASVDSSIRVWNTKLDED